VISGPYTKGSVKNGKKEVSSRSRSDEITMHWYRVLTFAKCTTIIIAELAVTSGLGSSLNRWIWNGYGYAMVLDRDGFGLAL
jgi:hypothetical protein